MERNELIFFFVLFVLLFSIASPIFFYLNSYQYLSNKDVTSAALANLNLTVIPTCGDTLCESDEDCGTCTSDCGECVCGDTFCEGNETCSNCEVDCGECSSTGTGSSGGGGGGGAGVELFFEFKPSILEVKLSKGASSFRTIEVKNIGRKDLSIVFSVIGVESYLYLDTQSMLLKRKETKEMNAMISTSEATPTGVYLGDIVGKVEEYEGKLPVVIRVSETGKNLLLDMYIPEEYKNIYAGEEILGQVSIYNNLSEVVNGKLVYSIRNKTQDIIKEYEEAVIVSLWNNSFEHKFITPTDLDAGYYYYYANFTYDEKSYSDASSFKVEGRLEKPSFLAASFVTIIKILILILLILFILYLIFRNRKRLLILAKKKLQEKPVDYLKLIDDTILQLNQIMDELEVRYAETLIDRYAKLMRNFFYVYYSYNKNLTFEELVLNLSNANIKHRERTSLLIKRISHIPYSKELVRKDQFKRIISESINLLQLYREDILQKLKENSKLDKKHKQ